MHRTPPKKTPRVAGIAVVGRRTALVVLDPWEVRVAMVAAPAALRRALLRERPFLIATPRRWPWLRRIGIALAVVEAPTSAALASYPELRRFAGTRHETLLTRALDLAEKALTHASHDHLVPQD